MLVLAHRGSHRDLPENSLAAFRRALDEGADGVELDVRTCRSGEVVVVHDPHLMRVGQDPAEVALIGLSRLRSIDLGGGERVPLLDEVLDLTLSTGAMINVEVKGDVPDKVGVARAVAQVVNRRGIGAQDVVILSTFDPTVLLALRTFAPRTRAALLLAELRRRDRLLLRTAQVRGVHAHYDLCTPERVRKWRDRGLFVHAWTVDSRARVRDLRDSGVNGVITDHVPRVLDALRSCD